jgi:uncharacterized protein (TIGR03437 family)
VTINGVPASLLFVSGGQLNLQVPFATSGTLATISVNNNGTISNEVTVPVAQTSPAIFSTDGTGFGPGTVVHADFSLVNEARSAAPNETVVIFLTGLGPLDPSIADGTPGPTAEPFSRTTDTSIQVLFAGEAGTVLFAGAAPGFVGLYQMNVTIPSTVVVGAAVPVAMISGNAFSCFTDIAIGL